MTLADRIISYNKSLMFTGRLPKGIEIMNPYQHSRDAMEISCQFYQKFYSDNRLRTLIMGINPGRHGAGVTGVPFTDTKRLTECCDLHMRAKETYEPSSVFVYDIIRAFGGTKVFYDKFYINSVCPLGFVIKDDKGGVKNFNYYDQKDLTDAVYDFIVDNLKRLIVLGMKTDKAFVLGSGKNYKFLSQLNKELGLFDELVALDHPRYVMQYKYRSKEKYIDKFVSLLSS